MILLNTLLLCTQLAGTTADITVSLSLEATVDGSEIVLADIASIEGENDKAVQMVGAFALGYAPSPGYSRVIQRWRVEQRLAGEFPALKLAFTGRTACRVWPRTADISAFELENAASEILARELGGKDVEYKLRGELSSEKVPAGRLSRRLEATLTQGVVNSSTVSVPVAIFIDEVKWRTVWVAFDVTVFHKMPVLLRPIPLGSKIKAGDLVLQRIPMEASSNVQALSAAMLVGATARRDLASHSQVLARDVVREKAVKEGETLALEIFNGRIRVKTKVMALADGYIGDVVTVQTLSNGKKLTVRVTQNGRVQLRLGTDQIH